MAEENPIEAVEPEQAHLDFAKADHEHAEYAHVGHSHEDLESRIDEIENWLRDHYEWHKQIDHTHESEKEESTIEKEAEPVPTEDLEEANKDGKSVVSDDGATHISVTESIQPGVPANTYRHGLKRRRK